MPIYLLFIIHNLWLTLPLDVQPLLLQGRMLDQESLQPIPYATVEIRGKEHGTSADSMGHFSLVLDGSFALDTLLVRALGYQDSLIAVDGLSPQSVKTLTLARKTYLLDSVSISPSGVTVECGISHPITRAGRNVQPGYQVAIKMKNPHRLRGIIQNARFYIVKSRKYKAPFRVRVYKVRADGSPGEDLLLDNVIVSAKKTRAWVEVDLTPYQIEVPPNGYFVAMEWIFTHERYYREKVYRSRRDGVLHVRKWRGYGQSLGNTWVSPEREPIPLTWVYRFGDGWMGCREGEGPFDRGSHYTAMIASDFKTL